VSSDELDEGELVHTALTPTKHSSNEPASSQLQLVVIANGNFATHTLASVGSFTIGRSKRCGIPIDDQSISRQHAILHVGETITIEDLGSVNGTQVRGGKIEANKPTPIGVGELIGVGTVSLILQQQSRPPVRPRRLWTHDDFEARLDEECARARRSGAPFALLRIHADRSPSVRYVEEALVELLRDSDIIGKYGPHEYELLLTDTPAARATEAVRRIEVRLGERGITCRIMVACCPRDGRSADQLTANVKPLVANDRVASIDIVVSDAQMQSLHRLVEQIAASNITVLLMGETGVGKEVFARAIHRASPRASGPFIEVNCAALTDTLLESELFGHEKGAFTHATTTKQGLIEAAHGGTLLLDEIGDMPLEAQSKLLRILEDSQIRRVGAVKARSVDIHVIAATNSDLEEQVAKGTFRRDLYFRLNGVAIVIPPLRERTAELEPLANAFIRSVWPHPDRPAPGLAPETLELMRSYSWPGNVRELKNMIARAVLLSGGGPIKPSHLPAMKMRAASHSEDASPSDAPSWRGGPPPPPPNGVGLVRARRGSDEEQRTIIDALDRAGGNQTTAARLLGISRRTLVNRLNEYKDLERPRKKRDN
jgi:two-component system, NtrC family, response regulator AtoC